MRVLLVSTYELGHQPLHVASPAAALQARGHEVRGLDLSVQPWDAEAVDWAQVVGFSVPMHTAMRLALAAAAAVRRRRPGLPLCFYGLYAAVGRDLTLQAAGDRAIAGEYEPALVDWVAEVEAGTAADPSRPSVELGRTHFRLPARHLLPPLERYARLVVGGEERLVGCVEASHGCTFRCRHCPVPSTYDGRIRIVGAEVVMADIAQLVAMGARHVTFADPDFLNGVHHSRRVVRELHRRFPEVTFDCTTRVELVLRHRALWDEMAASGCLFVVCAVESLNDDILARLDKGHTAADASEAVGVLRAAGIEMRPSFLPFTPWTTPDDVVRLLDFVATYDLVGNVDPVQYTIRLLLPEGSLLLDHPDVGPHLGPYDPERLGYAWRAALPEVDDLQARLATLVEAGQAVGEDGEALFSAVRRMVHRAAGAPEPAPDLVPAGSVEGRPRLTEPWFC